MGGKIDMYFDCGKYHVFRLFPQASKAEHKIPSSESVFVVRLRVSTQKPVYALVLRRGD